MKNADVLIVGGGIAGICAAIEALEIGRSVLLLDRDAEANFGGLAKESFGGIFLVDSPEQRRQGLKDSPELALADWLAFGELSDQDHWPMAWAKAYVEHNRIEVGDWLRAGGIRFFPVPNWIERGLTTRGNSVPRFHIVWGTGQVLALNLIQRLRQRRHAARLQLHFGQRVDRLVLENGRAVGVAGVAEESGQTFEFRAGAVIVAAGGINGSMDRVRQNWHADWSKPPQTLLNGSHRFADGRLHDAVAVAGGRITHLDRMWNYAAGVHHPRPRKPQHGLSLVPPRSALWLNWRGERFHPPLVSGFDTRDLVTRICREERAYSWQVMNRKIALKELAVSGAEFNPSIRERRIFCFLRDLVFGNRWLYRNIVESCEDFVIADTLAELVSRMNALNGDDAVQREAVEGAVAQYDRALADGGQKFPDEQLQRLAQLRLWKGDRIRTCKFQPIADPRAGPFIAVREFIISRKSLGGIATDLAGRALGAGGEPIPGLYAAGEAAGFGGGGMHGLRALEGSFLGGCIFSGRVAGREAARNT